MKSGWRCPGYEKTWKIIEEQGSLAKQYRTKRYVFEEGVAPPSRVVEQNDAVKELYRVGELSFSVNISRVSLCRAEKDAMRLAHMLDDPTSQLTFPIRSHGSFYSFIPSRLGRNPAMDDSISCLFAIYCDTMAKRTPSTSTSIQLYAKSLRSLRYCLEEQWLRTQSETICASLVLQICEV